MKLPFNFLSFLIKNKEDLSHKDFESFKKKIKIVLIDDERDSLPIEDLKQDGFNIKYYTNIDINLLNKILHGEFDIVILDIKGVANSNFINGDGFGIIEKVKKDRPTQIIIAFSNKSFDPTKHRFFTMADDVMPKPITFVSCKEKLEEIIKDKINIDYLWPRIKLMLEQKKVSPQDISKLKNYIYSKIKSKKKIDIPKILKKLNSLTDNSVEYLRTLNNLFELFLIFNCK